MAAGKVGVLRHGDLSNVSRKVYNSSRCEGFGFGYGEFGYGVMIRSKTDNVGYDRKRSNFKGKESMEVDGYPSQKRRRFSEDTNNLSFVLSKTDLYNDDLEPGEIVEEDCSRALSVFTSRWAYDDDKDQEQCSRQKKARVAVKGKEVKDRSSSPKSGVAQNEESDVSGNRSSGSDSVVVCPVRDLGNDDAMELEVSDVEDCILAGSSMLPGCRIVGKEYERLGVISEGSYGVVYKARDLNSKEVVALKKMKMGNEKEGFPVCFLREINILLSLKHPSIVSAREVVIDDNPHGFDNVYLVMDFMEHDLRALMEGRKWRFSQSEVKCLMLQLLDGVKYLHDNWVVHRDLKTSNILFNNMGELKICDFGMSRHYGSSVKPYTDWVVTLWYRAPELLLGARTYSKAVDMWSVGCIMAELLANKAFFDGNTELEQLGKIFRILGTPNDKIWPGYSQLPGVKANFVHQPYSLLHKAFPRASFTGSPTLSDMGFDLLSRLLTYDPEKRITAEEALNHRWFQEVPLPTTKEFMPTFPSRR